MFEQIIKRGIVLAQISVVTVATSAAAESPNFLILFADDLGFETLGSYGGTDYETPNIDRLAGEGLRFSRAYTSPVCTPSRMSLYTGTYASTHRYTNVLPVHQGTKKAVDFKSKWTTYAQLLRGAGYATSVTGKWQLATLEHHPDHLREAGFDSWCIWQIWRDGAKTTRYWQPALNHDGALRDDVSERFGPDVLAEYVVDQMKAAVAEKQPFCIHHNFMLPHEPNVTVPGASDSTLDGMITYLDKLVGDLVSEVDALGIAEETWIIFMGDNGTMAFGENRTLRDGTVIKGGKYELTEAGTHIPLIVRRTGVTDPGTTADELIDMADWLPTLCDLADVALPDGLKIDGQSFAARLETGDAPEAPREWVTAGFQNAYSVSDGSHRVTSGKPGGDAAETEALQSVLDRLMADH